MKKILFIVVLVVILSLILPTPTSAKEELPIPTKVEAIGSFILEINQQPSNNYMYVGNSKGSVTLYSLALKRGVYGLLAHNYLSGKKFYQLKRGYTINLYFGDRIEKYKVVRIRKFSVPGSRYEKLVDLDTGKILTEKKVFKQIYTKQGSLVFQTCLDDGLIFIIATKIPEGKKKEGIEDENYTTQYRYPYVNVM